MSFSSDIKKQLCTIINSCEYCNFAELTGMLEFSIVKKDDSLRITTESSSVAKKIFDLTKQCFGIELPQNQNESNKLYAFEIDDNKIIENISDKLMLFNNSVSQEEKFSQLIPFDCCKSAYVRGAFLGGGSITNPKKSYHLEFPSKYEYPAQQLKNILAQVNFPSKIIYRKPNYIVYIKEYEKIADILGYIGACNAVLQLYNIQIEKEMRNSVNRQVNCETANMDKVIIASLKQIDAITKIQKKMGIDKLPDTLQEMANIRLAYPDESLKELSQRLQIGKSGVNHRLNRLIEIANEL